VRSGHDLPLACKAGVSHWNNPVPAITLRGRPKPGDGGEAMAYRMSRRVALIGAGALSLAWSAPTLAAAVHFKVALSGTNSVPPVQTPGKGTADITYDPATRAVTWTITYGGLASTVTMAHFHKGGKGENGPVVIWLCEKGAPVGDPITGKVILTPDEATQFLAGDWYINVHTKNHPAGAIRGQVLPPTS
jgi:CHRD domain